MLFLPKSKFKFPIEFIFHSSLHLLCENRYSVRLVAGFGGLKDKKRKKSAQNRLDKMSWRYTVSDGEKMGKKTGGEEGGYVRGNRWL